jgi:chemotaxis methyl-accepting protein methylase
VTVREDFGLAEVMRHHARGGGGGFEWYKDSCLLRRIEVRMRARGVHTLAAYAVLLEQEPGEVDVLLHTLSVRVTSFFRNPDTWQRLLQVLHEDGVGTVGSVTAWSMGCSTGEEAWSLAMLLLWYAREAGARLPPEGITVYASDLDTAALATAAAGRYPSVAVEAIREVVGDPFGAVEADSYVVAPAVRPRVVFRREDLTAAVPAPGWCDVVCCRNLLIFLGREGQRRVLSAAFHALRQGGLLVLGRTESLVALPEAPLAPVDVTHRIYRRVR